jgi:hypothetical protein
MRQIFIKQMGKEMREFGAIPICDSSKLADERPEVIQSSGHFVFLYREVSATVTRTSKSSVHLEKMNSRQLNAAVGRRLVRRATIGQCYCCVMCRHLRAEYAPEVGRRLPV